MISRAAALVLAGLTTSACTIDIAEDAALYRDVLGAGEPASALADPPAGATVGVVESMRLANARNERLRIEGEGYVRALLDRRRVASRFLPRVDLVPEYFLDEAEGDGPRNGLDVPLELSLDVDPISDRADERAARAAATRRRSLLLALQDDILLETARAHLEVVRAERRVDVLRASIRVQDERIDDARARVDAGVARPLDAALSEARAADTKVLLVDAETDVRTGRTLLSYLTAWDTGATALDPALPAVADEEEPFDAALAAAFRDREDLRASLTAVEVAEHAVIAAYGRYWPSVSADLTVFLQRDTEPTDLDWRSAISLSLPLFDAGLIETDVRDALSRLREAREAWALGRRAVRRDVLDAAERLDSARRRIGALVVRRDAARRSLDHAEGLWAAGLGTNLERLAAQDELLSADLELADAELVVTVRRVERLRAGGRLHALLGLARGTPEGGHAASR